MPFSRAIIVVLAEYIVRLMMLLWARVYNDNFDLERVS